MSSNYLRAISFAALIFGTLSLWMGFHAVDVSHNVAMFYNDINAGTNIDLNLRQAYDCNLLECRGYVEGYKLGMTLILTSHVILFASLLFWSVARQ